MKKSEVSIQPRWIVVFHPSTCGNTQAKTQTFIIELTLCYRYMVVADLGD